MTLPIIHSLMGRLLPACCGAAMASSSIAAQTEHNFHFEHPSCGGGAFEIKTVVTGLKKSAGLIVAELYPDKQEGFLSGATRLQIVRFAAKAPVTKFCLRAPEAGAFAVSVYQDVNANTDFDKGPFGLPAEPWGLSNNPPVRLRLPRVDETVFDVDALGAQIEIKLN